MSTASNARLRLRPDGRGELVVNGVNIADHIESLTIHVNPDMGSTMAWLNLAGLDVVEGEVTPLVTPEAAGALVALGWTPPGCD